MPSEDEAQEASASQILDPCPSCATLIDVTDIGPFEEIHCPVCGQLFTACKQFNHYALQCKLGEGGMGTVFEAIDVNLQRRVAIKILNKEYSQDEKNIELLETEARITASINHPHVVKVFSAGRDHGKFYLAMELVAKGTLDQLMNFQGRIPEVQALEVGVQIADGLRAALHNGLIHRDVKPGNILFADAHLAKIVDFGLALLMEGEAKARGEIWGTPYYVAPEKLNYEPEDFRSDIYSLGGTLFHAISGRPPFEAESASLVALKHMKSQNVSLQAFAPDVSNETAYVINRMLNKDPGQRYQSYDELIEHLQYAKARLLERTAAGQRTRRRVQVETTHTQTFIGWLTLLFILAFVAGGVWVWLKRDIIFAKPNQDMATEKSSSRDGGENYQTAYENARKAIVSGDFSEAIGELDKIIESNDVPQPALNWAIAHKGLALTMVGSLREAREIFEQLETGGLYSDNPAENKLANFFVELGRLMKHGKPIVGGTTRAYGNTDFEAFAVLIFAMKDWQLKAFSDAGELLEHFQSGQLMPDYVWIGDYKQLTKPYLADLQLYRALKAQIDAATTPELKAATLQAVRNARGKLATQGPLVEQFTQWETELSKATEASAEASRLEREAATHETAENEAKLWAKEESEVGSALLEFSPETILPKISSLSFATPELERARTIARKKLAWLSELKAALIDQLPGGKYTGDVINRSGGRIKGGVIAADSVQVQIRSPYGNIPVMWKAVSPETVLAMSDALLMPPRTGDAQREAYQQWLAGCYAVCSGMDAKGRDLLIAAAQTNAALRDELPVFFEEAKQP
ncbi:MAG TPA: protein kinase [Chthoniobacterales bacterium]